MQDNNVFKYLTNYKTQSVIFKNFLIILIILILPMTVLFINLYRNYSRAATEKLNNMYRSRFNTAETTFDEIYDQTRLFTYSLAGNEAVINFAAEPYSPSLYKIADYNQIIGASGSAFTYVDSVYIYSNVNNYVLSGTTNDVLDSFHDRSWLSEYAYLSADTISIVPRIIEDTDNYYISFILAIRSRSGEKIGAVVVNMNTALIMNTILPSENDNFDVYVLNSYKKALLSTEMENLFNKYNQNAYVYDKIENSIDKGYFTYDNTSEKTKLQYVLIAKHNQSLITPQNVFIIILMLLLTLLIALIAALFLAIRTFKPIQNIIDSVSESFDSDKKLNIDNEISLIVENINSTIQDKRLAEIELEQRIALLNNAYTVALQAQINPHFLYNTLETINFMAYKQFKKQNDISTITVSLSKMLRIGLDSEKKLVPLKTEKEHICLYIEIMKLRYPGKCEFLIDIPPEYDDCMVVKLMLQPLIENAFQHGIRHSKRAGIIRISAERKNDCLILTVADNGAGMDKKTLAFVKSILSSEVYIHSKHIGINNVNRRVKLLLGKDYGVNVTSEEGVGSTFTITLPYTQIKEKNDEQNNI